MAKQNVPSGGITADVLYEVTGNGSITYNGGSYTGGQQFRGMNGVTSYTQTGTANVWQVVKIASFSVQTEAREDTIRYPGIPILQALTIETIPNHGSVLFPETTILQGLKIETEIRADKITFPEITILAGITVETVDRPEYARFPERVLFAGISVDFEPRATFKEKTIFNGLNVEFEIYPESRIIWFY